MESCQAIDSFLRGVYINVGEILNSDWLKSYIYFPYTPTQPISKKQEILWYELIHNYIPFLLKTSKGTRNYIRSMTLYVSMLFYPLYEVPKRCDCKIKFFHDPTVLLLWHPIQPPPKSVFVVKSYKSSMIYLLTAPLNCKITWQFLNTTDWLSS